MRHARPSLLLRPAARVAAALLVLVALVGVVPAHAAGGSIVFVLDHDVWIMPADDPGQARPVTVDGTSGVPYTYPAQEDDGTIMAVRGRVEEQQLVLMDQSGNLLQAPFRPSGYEGIEELAALDLDPTGTAVALNVASTQGGGGSGGDIQRVDGGGSLVPGVLADSPSWYAPGKVVAASGGELTTYEVGASSEQTWFETCVDVSGCRFASSPEITRDRTRLVGVELGGGGDLPRLHTWRMTDPPPAEPTFECTVVGPQGNFADPSWSPDGSHLVVAFQDGVFGEPAGMQPGLYILSGFGSQSCDEVASSTTLAVPDASQPDWGPAAVGPYDPRDPGDPGDPGGPGGPGGPGDPGGPGGGGGVVRVAGDTRYDTAVELTRRSFDPDVGTAYVATGTSFPDALAGGVAAAVTGSPLLLVGQDSVPPETAGELDRLEPRRIVVLGGPVAVSEGVREGLAEFTDGDVARLAGGDRYATAGAIAADAFPTGAGTVLVANGQNFPDALSGVPAAAIARGPILLTATDTLPDATRDALTSLDPDRILILGGEVAVSAVVEEQLRDGFDADVSRRSGADRYATSAAISALAFDSAETVFVATGTVFADALAAGAVAGALPGPVLLTDPASLPGAIADEVDRLGAGRVMLLGGVNAVSIDVEAQLQALVE